MRVVGAPVERESYVAPAALLGAVALVISSLVETQLRDVALLAAAALIVTVFYRTFLSWRGLLSGLILIILFVPIRRYILPGGLPFQLEPYRLLVAFLIVGWTMSLLADPRVRVRKTGYEGPLALIVLATLTSVVTNGSRVDELGSEVAKSLTFFASFVLIFFLSVSVVRDREAVERLLKIIVFGGAVVAVLAVVEARTRYNPFNDIEQVLPFVEQVREADLKRGARFRATGPAQHPIALSALLVLIVPLAVYLAHGLKRPLWWIAVGLLTIGAVSTVSRTGVLMLGVATITFLLLRPEARKLWPALLPLIAAVHFAVPGTLGTLKASFFPEGGLIAEQSNKSPATKGGGRIADLGPALGEASQRPLWGQGYGTRIVNYRIVNGEIVRPNAFILDNEWLGILLETGALGLIGWAWFFWRFLKRVGGLARRTTDSTSWLFTALAASVASFAIGMFTFDAFSFIQVTFLAYFLFGFGAVLHSRYASPTGVMAQPST